MQGHHVKRCYSIISVRFYGRNDSAFACCLPFKNCSCFVTLFLQLTTDKSRKKILISPPRKSKKNNNNLTIDLLSLGIYNPGPQVLTYRPQILRGVRIWTPFRGSIPKLTSYSDSPYPKPPPNISWYPRVFLGGFTEPNSISARAGVAVPAGNRFGSVNPPKNTRGYQEMCGVGFRVRGIRIWS